MAKEEKVQTQTEFQKKVLNLLGQKFIINSKKKEMETTISF